MPFTRKTRWAAGCGALVLITLLIAAAWLWTLVPQRTVGQYFDSGGVKIHYTDEGRGTPVILIHGLAVNADIQWRRPGIAQALLKDYRVVALDQRGHGLSGKPHDPASYGVNMANDVIALMDHLHIDKAHVVGYSFGGFVTVKLVAMHPERILSAAVCGAGWEQPSDANQAFAEAVAKALESGSGFGPLNRRLGLRDEAPRLRTRLMLRFALNFLNDRQALAAVMRGGLTLAVTEDELRANNVPVLAMIGSVDGLRPAAEELAQRMAHCELVLIDGAGHMNAPGKPAFLEHLQRFLADHTPKSEASACVWPVFWRLLPAA